MTLTKEDIAFKDKEKTNNHQRNVYTSILSPSTKGQGMIIQMFIYDPNSNA